LDFYFHQCADECEELANSFLFFAEGKTKFGKQVLTRVSQEEA
jgi:glutaminase